MSRGRNQDEGYRLQEAESYQPFERADFVVLPRAMSPRLRGTLIGICISVLLGGILARIGLGWPSSYGIRCRRRCFFTEIIESGRLLDQPNALELFLFAAIWLPLIIFAMMMIAWFLRVVAPTLNQPNYSDRPE